MLSRNGRAFDQPAFARLAEHGWVPLPPRPSRRAADTFAGRRLGWTESLANKDSESARACGAGRDRHLEHRVDRAPINFPSTLHERRALNENNKAVLVQFSR